MKFTTSRIDKNKSIRLFSRKETKEEILRFKTINKRDVGSGAHFIACPAKGWGEVVVLATLIARETDTALTTFYYDEQKKILFTGCSWFNKDPDEMKSKCIDLFKRYLGNPHLSTILYDTNGDPLFSESKEAIDKFMGDLPSTPDEYHTFKNFPDAGYQGIKMLSRFSVFNPSQMELM
jgi:hypothetical protein